MGQAILIDNDALLKLARYGLIDEALTVFGCTPADVNVLAAAKYSLLPTKNRLRLCKDEESVTRLEAFLRTSKTVDTGSADPDILDVLNTIPNIDGGEAILFAVGATNRDSLVITGDKRSLAALCSHDSVTHVSNALLGRVVSMEVLFLMLIERQFVLIQERVRAKPDVDKTLMIVFGVSVAVDFESVREGLDSYINSLRSKTGTLLYVPLN
jgi:hypothetical protein